MKIAVLGASGQLGRAVAGGAATRLHEVTALTRQDANLSDPAQLRSVLTRVQPDAIINCAAFARVDDAEDAPVRAFAANAFGPRALARIANDLGAVLVHYSTDFVFDGLESGPNTEDRAPRPRGVYATSKLVGEWFAAEAARHYVLRVESLFGSPLAKSSIDVMLRTIRDGREVHAFSDRTVTPSYIVDVAGATLALLERGIAPGLYHCVNSGTTTWTDVAHELARLAGRPDARITPVAMASLSMRVPRPLNAALSNAKLAAAGVPMPIWQDALARFVNDAGVAAPWR
jgi:dTDP-4-dehydrorhamnose reductase